MPVRLLSTDSAAAFMSEQWVMLLLVLSVGYLLWKDALSLILEQGIITFLCSFWNILDVVHLGIMVGLVVHWGMYVSASASAWEALRTCAASAMCYMDFGAVLSASGALRNTGSAAALLSAFKVFKYLRLNARMNTMWHVFGLAAWDLFAFGTLFVLVMCAYTIMGHVAFGAHIRDFHALTSSWWEVFAMLLGVFDFDALVSASPTIAPLFFGSFMLLVYVCILNMFIGASAPVACRGARGIILVCAPCSDSQRILHAVTKRATAAGCGGCRRGGQGWFKCIGQVPRCRAGKVCDLCAAKT
jgi:Polycystin cation channel